MWTFCGALLILAGGLPAQELPRATMEYGAFAFADAGGTRLISTAEVADAWKLHTAICENGRRVAVKFVRRQEARESGTGRETAANFDRLRGSIYAVTRGKVATGATCFLASDELARSAAVWRAVPRSGECGMIASSRGRPVANCWTLAPGVVLAEFVRQGKDALASVVVREGSRLLFADYPAEFVQEGGDLWRADDNGVLRPEAMRVVFLLRRGESVTLGIDFLGPEGDSLSVWTATTEDRFTPVLRDYWYRSPL